jgi:ribulose 1,5-bisphosphate carboxylase large subunit-like protein
MSHGELVVEVKGGVGAHPGGPSAGGYGPDDVNGSMHEATEAMVCR